MQLDTLFNPQSVAIIGANDEPASVGYALMKNILSGSAREVYPVTLGTAEVMGHAAYTSVSMIPRAVDLAVIAIRADIVPTVLEECAEKGIKNVVLISAGFKEMGADGAALEQTVADIAHKHDIALLGPNCLGVMNAQRDFNASFAVNSPKKGDIAFVSQSGALGTALLDWANQEGVGFSKFVSLGNEAVLTELDFMEYLVDDPKTKAVLLYLEQVADGARFMELAKRITAKKPLVVLRAGRSARGSTAVSSHTGSLAPSDKIFEAALRQVGAIPVETLRTLFALAKLFSLGNTKPLTSLAIVTNGGGPSVNTADLIEFSHSLSLVSFNESTKDALREVLPPMAAVNNPIDVIGDAGPDRYDGCLNILSKRKDIDAIITLVTPQMMTDPKGIAETLLTHTGGTPIIPVFMGGETVQEGKQTLINAGMTSFDSPTDVVEALDALANLHAKPVNEESTRGDTAHETPHTMMPLEDMRRILTDYDLPLAGVFARTPDEVAGALKKLGDGPYAMKAISQQLVHKSDMHAVHTELNDVETITATWEETVQHVAKHAPDATIDGMLLQNMVTGTECILGMKRDATFGPVIVFGLGGIFVEVLKDSSMRIAPVSKDDALAQIKEIQGLPLLMGARGAEPVNLEALAAAIASLSHLALDFPDIQEIDLNPVFATAMGVEVVDARLMVRNEKQEQ